MSKVMATGEAITVGGGLPQESPVNSNLVPIVTLVANAADMNGALFDLAHKIQALIGESKASARGLIDIAELRIDIDAQRVTVGGDEIFLTALEFKLLVMLATRREQVQPRSKLLSEVWSCSPLSKTRTVDTHVKRLRDKLQSAERFIRTIRGTGYLFTEFPSRRGRWPRASDDESSAPSLRSAAGG